MKRGFTLVEILAVIIIIGIIALIAIPSLNNILKENKEDLYNLQIDQIKSAAEKWGYENLDLLPTTEGGIITVFLGQLKENNYIEKDIIDPITEEPFASATAINIIYENNKYKYEVITVLDNNYQSSANGPQMSLNGDSIIYLSLGSEYEELSVTSEKDGIEYPVFIQYKINGIEKSSIDTSSDGTYTVIYSSSLKVGESVYTSYVVRTVIISE